MDISQLLFGFIECEYRIWWFNTQELSLHLRANTDKGLIWQG